MYEHLTIETIGHVVHVRLRQARLVEDQLAVMIDELFDLGQNGPSPKVVFCLGPEPPLFLYSIFLARLVTLQRCCGKRHGSLVLCEVAPEVMRVFGACKLDEQFVFAKDLAEAERLLCDVRQLSRTFCTALSRRATSLSSHDALSSNGSM